MLCCFYEVTVVPKAAGEKRGVSGKAPIATGKTGTYLDPNIQSMQKRMWGVGAAEQTQPLTSVVQLSLWVVGFMYAFWECTFYFCG
jgi:hypothetical protein